MFYVYLLQDTEGDLYTGYTSDLRKRLKEHNQGKTISTKNRRWSVIYYEACMQEGDARRREKYLKTTHGKRMIKLRLKEHFYKRAS